MDRWITAKEAARAKNKNIFEIVQLALDGTLEHKTIDGTLYVSATEYDIDSMGEVCKTTPPESRRTFGEGKEFSFAPTKSRLQVFTDVEKNREFAAQGVYFPSHKRYGAFHALYKIIDERLYETVGMELEDMIDALYPDKDQYGGTSVTYGDNIRLKEGALAYASLSKCEKEYLNNLVIDSRFNILDLAYEIASEGRHVSDITAAMFEMNGLTEITDCDQKAFKQASWAAEIYHSIKNTPLETQITRIFDAENPQEYATQLESSRILKAIKKRTSDKMPKTFYTIGISFLLRDNFPNLSIPKINNVLGIQTDTTGEEQIYIRDMRRVKHANKRLGVYSCLPLREVSKRVYLN